MPLNYPKAVAEIDAVCRQFADPQLVRKYARFFREGYDAYGVDHKNPLWEQKIQEWEARWKAEGLPGILALGVALFATGKYEHGAVAIRLAMSMRGKIRPTHLSGLAAWLAEVRNWAHCDVICGELIAPRVQAGAIPPARLKGWAKSPHRFVRRALPVSLLGALKAPFNAEELLALVRPLMTDPERVVQQGMGWFLRELWKLQPEPVEALLLEWKDTAPRLIFQYATEKMDAKGKARFRRAPSSASGPTARALGHRK